MPEPFTVREVVSIELSALFSRNPLIPEAIIVIIVVDRHLVLIRNMVSRLHVIDARVRLQWEVSHASLHVGLQLEV